MKSNIINVICHTNLDDYDCTTVTEMCCRPQVGDKVQCYFKRDRRYLKIVSITHLKGPSLLIELNN